MAFRLYLANTTVDPETSAYTLPSSGWNSAQGGAIIKKATTTRGVTTTGTLTAGGGAATGDRQHAAHITSPIAAQTITGTVKGQIRVAEQTTADDRYPQFRLLVMNGPCTTVRGTLYDFDASALSHEFATATTNRQFPRGGAVSVTSVSAFAGDRLVVETGYGRTSINGNNVSFIYQDDDVTTDLPEDETTTAANNTWVELSQSITFGTIVPVLMASYIRRF